MTIDTSFPFSRVSSGPSYLECTFKCLRCTQAFVLPFTVSWTLDKGSDYFLSLVWLWPQFTDTWTSATSRISHLFNTSEGWWKNFQMSGWINTLMVSTLLWQGRNIHIALLSGQHVVTHIRSSGYCSFSCSRNGQPRTQDTKISWCCSLHLRCIMEAGKHPFQSYGPVPRTQTHAGDNLNIDP